MHSKMTSGYVLDHRDVPELYTGSDYDVNENGIGSNQQASPSSSPFRQQAKKEIMVGSLYVFAGTAWHGLYFII